MAGPKTVEPFDAREAAAAAADEYPEFEFFGMDGETYSLPNPYMLNPAELREQLGLEDGDGMEGIDDIDESKVLENMVPEAWAAIQQMPLVIQRKTIEAWQTACGLDDDDDWGKEPSKSSGRKSTGKPSKRTSRSGAKTSGRSRSGG